MDCLQNDRKSGFSFQYNPKLLCIKPSSLLKYGDMNVTMRYNGGVRKEHYFPHRLFHSNDFVAFFHGNIENAIPFLNVSTLFRKLFVKKPDKTLPNCGALCDANCTRRIQFIILPTQEHYSGFSYHPRNHFYYFCCQGSKRTLFI